MCPRWHSSCSFITFSGWAVGLEVPCRSLSEKPTEFVGICALVTVGREIHTQLWGRLPALRRWHPCTDFRERKIYDESPYLDCPNEGVCWILPTVTVEPFPDYGKIRTRTAQWETGSMADPSGKYSILEPFLNSATYRILPVALQKETYFTSSNSFDFGPHFPWISINIPWKAVFRSSGPKRQVLRGDKG